MATADPTDPEDGLLAAEFALGTLGWAEKAAAESRIRSDRAFAESVAAWERRLDPLLDAFPAMTPPPQVLSNVMKAIDRGPAFAANETLRLPEIERLKRSMERWRRIAYGSMALAASFLGAFVFVTTRSRPAVEFVAVLEGQERAPAFVAAVDTNRGTVAIRRIVNEPAPGRSYELWSITEKTPPRSLGLVDRSTGVDDPRLIRTSGGKPLSAVLLAVTLEQEGGSPTGKPTASPVYTGHLVEVPRR